ncbi:MAG: hypothetical protein K0A99_04225 [Desulfoarculaceae bacterium]|nr:hypothetical protein [Desulfoarculaceae bacterium]
MAKKFLVLALVLAMALIGWLTSYFSTREVLKRQLTGIAVALGKEGQETAVQMALKMRDVKNMLAVSCLVTIPESGYSETMEQDLIIRYLMSYRHRYALLTVTLEDLHLDIPVKGQAVAQTTVRLRLQSAPQAEPVEESHHMTFSLTRVDKQWLFQTITVPETLLR